MAIAWLNTYSYPAYNTDLPDPPLPTPTPVAMYSPILRAGGGSRGPAVSPAPVGRIGRGRLTTPWERQINSIFMNPVLINIGTSAAESNHVVDVWHTYLTPLGINEIAESGTRGMTLTRTDPDGVDTTDPIPAYGQALYNLHIGIDTETTIDGRYEWRFDSGATKLLRVTGLRATLFPFMPQGEFTETFEWATSVLRAVKSEERHSIRAYPREELEFAYLLTSQEYSAMKNLMRGWNLNPFAVPLWMEVSQIGFVAEGTTDLSFDTTTGRYETGAMIVLWDTNEFAQVGVITDLRPDGITFDPPLAEDRANLYVAPVRLAQVYSGAQISRATVGVERATIQFSLGETTYPDTNPFPLWRGYPVLTLQPLNNGSVTDELYQEYNVVDFTTGIQQGLPEFDYMRFDRSMTYPIETRSQLSTLRNFLGWTRGRYEQFWVPSWNADLELLESITAGEDEIVTRATGLARYQEIDDFAIILKNGDFIYNRITSTYLDVFENEVHILASPITINIQPEDVHMICKLEMSRLNTDRFEISYQRRSKSLLTFPVVKVPDGDI
ncbi:tail assembly protein [Vibrio phage 033B]|nr:tail assembly protein [Vibrio phage 033B]